MHPSHETKFYKWKPFHLYHNQKIRDLKMSSSTTNMNVISANASGCYTLALAFVSSQPPQSAFLLTFSPAYCTAVILVPYYTPVLPTPSTTASITFTYQNDAGYPLNIGVLNAGSPTSLGTLSQTDESLTVNIPETTNNYYIVLSLALPEKPPTLLLPVNQTMPIGKICEQCGKRNVNDIHGVVSMNRLKMENETAVVGNV